MKFDLIEIHKLSPPGLWVLAPLSALIGTLLTAVEVGVGGSLAVLRYSRMVARHSREFRAKTRENLNIRIKAWVMQSPERIAWVKGIIGEPAIKRWRKNKLAEYALSKYFGDWKAKFPDGFECRTTKKNRNPADKQNHRTYYWKPFSLTKIFNVAGFLYGQSRENPEVDEIQAAYHKLWNVDIMDADYLYPAGEKGAQPRDQRTFKPVEFTPDELVPEAATGAVISVPKDARNMDGETGGMTVFPPPKPTRNSPNAKTARDPNTEKPP